MAKKFQVSSLDMLGQTGQPVPFVYSRRYRVDPFNLLGQAEIYPYPAYLPGTVQPKLTIAWNSFHQNFFSGIPVLFQSGRLPKDAPPQRIFRDCIVEGPVPRRAILAAFLLYVAAIVMPWPNLPAAPRRNPAFDNTELTWSGHIEDLPLLNIPKQKSAGKPKAPAADPVTAQSTDAFHPRQRIYTDPVRPTHPRQTLINPAAAPEAPKFLPPMPNVVQFASAPAPARPHIEISEKTLAKLRPKKVKAAVTTEVPTPDVPNLEQHTTQISLATSQAGPARPKLQINAGSAPRVAERSQSGENAPAPDAALSSSTNAGGASSTLIALSNSPAPPAPVVPGPQGNLAAHVAISPEGKPGGTGSSANTGGNAGAGTGGGNGGAEAGNSSVGISISGGNPKPNVGASGLGNSGKLTLPRTPSGYKRPDPTSDPEDPPERTGPPNFAALAPDAKPEQIFSSKRVYSMNVNMPNLNSATGSWIIHFSELHLADYRHRSGNVSAPVPLRKVDPKYPQTLMQDHVEGQVILYGVIRKDGTVDSIQVVHGIDEQLDANAASAFAQWKFEPATKEEQPVDLEAIVYIPFHAPAQP
jgi:TonB family protein